MGLLDSLKDKLGLKKKPRGHTLGNGISSSAQNEEAIFDIPMFDVNFPNQTLGLVVEAAPAHHPFCGAPLVVSVSPGSDAEKGGVLPGDIIMSLDSNDPIQNTIQHSDFILIAQALGRPLSLKFSRIAPRSSQPPRLTTAKLSSEDKAVQREAMINAALSREKAWDKRVASASSARRKKVLL
jgi:C-terminal processing protease CtpA/Prc